MYDVIVIGGGVSGLYSSMMLSKNKSVVLIDDRTYIGGRIRTHKRPQYEIGAARFSKQHKIFMRISTRRAPHAAGKLDRRSNCHKSSRLCHNTRAASL